MPNYFNPSATKPNAEEIWGSGGPMSQMFGMRDRGIYDQAMDLQDLMSQLQNQQQQQQNIRYAGETPNFLSESNLKGEMARRSMPLVPQFLRGKVGEAQQQEAEGRIRLGTADSKIESTNTENKWKNYENLIKYMDLHSKTLGKTNQKGSPLDPSSATRNYSRFRNGLPESIKDRFPENYDPSVHKTITDFRDGLKDSVEHRRNVELEEMKEAAALARQKQAGADALKAAQVRATARVRSLIEEFNRAKNPEKLSLGPQLLADEDIPESVKQQVREALVAARNAMAAQVDKNSFAPEDLRNPRRPGDRILERLNAGDNPQPILGKTPEGYDVISPRQPDGSYKIRDPKTGRTGTYRP